MARNILLIEPNYKNKFPPIGLMKLATYHKRMGDNVVFFKGEIKDLIVGRIAEHCINHLEVVEPRVEWTARKDVVIKYIKTSKKEHLVRLIEGVRDEVYLLVKSWLNDAARYYKKKRYLDEPEWDRIFVSTLFTFYFDVTVKTILEVKPLVKPEGVFMVGGVLASLQPIELEEATGVKPYVGLLNKPGILDPNNTDIIDELPLDYTILEETDYEYEMSDAYYASMSKGCVRHCPFCAVPKLEPDYRDYIPLKERIQEVDATIGPQRNLLLMDNNIMASKKFDEVIEEIITCGFGRGATLAPPDALKIAVENIIRGINKDGYIRKAVKLLDKFLSKIKDADVSFKVYATLENYHLLKYETATAENVEAAYHQIKDEYEAYRCTLRPRQRSVDFNQGLDARLFDDHKAEQLARIAITPVRIAFDDLRVKDAYLRAIKMCHDHGLSNFSNYLLYNFKDQPWELYERMRINVELCEEIGVNIYSFPMKYHPLYGEHSHDRDFIGEHWNRKYIRAIQAVLNCTKGMIGRGTTYFRKAFGENLEEFARLLELPDTYIIYRFFFEWLDRIKHPLSAGAWEETFNSLSATTKEELFSIIHSPDFNDKMAKHIYPGELGEIMKFYVNMREAVQSPNGSLYKLKQEFDSLSSVHDNRTKRKG